MFAASKIARSKFQRRAAIESLEKRELMTRTWIVMDFTPDTHYGTFYDTFARTRVAGNYAPGWLDFNGDRRISMDDARIAAGQIGYRVQQLFGAACQGNDVRFQAGDVDRDTKWGNRFVEWGLRSGGDQVEVMFFGGRNRGELGRAPQANDGSNIEGFGQCYTQEVANMMVAADPTGRRFSTRDFVLQVSQVASHELGHMFGLRHSAQTINNYMMNPSASWNPGAASFFNANVRTYDGTVQNSYRELWYSFYGQRTVYAGYSQGYYQMPADAKAVDAALASSEAAPTDNALAIDVALATMAQPAQEKAVVAPAKNQLPAAANLLALEQAAKKTCRAVHEEVWADSSDLLPRMAA